MRPNQWNTQRVTRGAIRTNRMHRQGIRQPRRNHTNQHRSQETRQPGRQQVGIRQTRRQGTIRRATDTAPNHTAPARAMEPCSHNLRIILIRMILGRHTNITLCIHTNMIPGFHINKTLGSNTTMAVVIDVVEEDSFTALRKDGDIGCRA